MSAHTFTYNLIFNDILHFYADKSETFTIFFHTHFSNRDIQPNKSPPNVVKNHNKEYSKFLTFSLIKVVKIVSP